jgi:hypothetical protein
MCGQSSELEQNVTFQSFSQADVIEVVEAVDRVMKSLIVLFFDKEIIVSIVDARRYV